MCLTELFLLHQVMGENESRCATITILPNTDKEAGSHIPPISTPETTSHMKSSQSLSSHTTDQPPSVRTAETPRKTIGNAKNTKQLKTTTFQQSAAAKPSHPISLHLSSTSATTSHAQGTASVLPSASKVKR